MITIADGPISGRAQCPFSLRSTALTLNQQRCVSSRDGVSASSRMEEANVPRDWSGRARGLVRGVFGCAFLAPKHRPRTHATAPFPPLGDRVASLTSASNYERFNSSNIRIHFWSWTHRGCWHQTDPPVGNHCSVCVASIAKQGPSVGWTLLPFLVAASPCCVTVGQFARLLPSLDVVAISQATCPESNPRFPVTRDSHGGPWHHHLADRAETRLRTLQQWKKPIACRNDCPVSPFWITRLLFVHSERSLKLGQACDSCDFAFEDGPKGGSKSLEGTS